MLCIPKATVLRHTDQALLDCPVLEGTARVQYHTAFKAANEFSLACLEWLQKRKPEERAAWVTANITTSRELFQPWSMEILYVIATIGRVRFSQLHAMLGLSTRTLSDKLKALRRAGLIHREVFDEQPIRIEYFLTKHGAKTAALASPLLCHLTQEAVRSAAQAKAPSAPTVRARAV